MSYDLTGRSAIVTGGSQGLGLAISRTLISAGANVMICGRDQDALDRAYSELTKHTPDDQQILAQVADVSQPADVESLVARALETWTQIQIVVNNAGVYGPMGGIENIDWSEWTRAIEVNLYGSVLMCRALLPHFKENRYGKIIQLSGGGATSPLPNLSAYAASKAGVVRFVETLAEECRPDKIDVNAIAPGALNTRLLDEVLEAGPEKVGVEFYERSLNQAKEGGTPPDKAAELAVFLGSADSDGLTGKLISAVWDPWRTFPEHLQELVNSDVYTLRRIVPEHRSSP